MAVSIKQLSEYCGISASAVSKALNGYSDVSAETRQKVLAAAQKLGYRPSAIARGLKTGRTGNIGVLYNEVSGSGLAHNYFAPVLEAFKAETERRGYDITFLSRELCVQGPAKMNYLEHSLYRNVDGVCVVCCDFNDQEVIDLINGPLPVVTIDQPMPGRCCVASENEKGMRTLTEYILSMGHRRIAYITGAPAESSKERLEGFRAAMHSAGVPIPDGFIVESVFHNPKATREVTGRLLKTPDRPTCIIMPDDFAALGGMNAAEEAGLRIPEDLSIAGFDGVPILQMCRPCLTTVAQDTARIGQTAAAQLIAAIESPLAPVSPMVTIPTRLIHGATVSAPV